MRSTVVVSIRMPVEWRDELFAQATRERRTVSEVGRDIIEADRAALAKAKL